MESTQYAVSCLGVNPPLPGGDQRHREDVCYPFIDYDDLRDNDDTSSTIIPGKLYFSFILTTDSDIVIRFRYQF